MRAAFRRWWGLLFLAAALVPITILEPYTAGPPIRDEALASHRWAQAFLAGAPEISPAEHTAAQVLGATALLALSSLLLSVCYRLGASAGASNVALLVIVFGTGLFHAGTHNAAFATIYSALGVGALLWLGVRGSASLWLALAIFLVVFLLLLVRGANILVVTALALVWLFGRVWWGQVGIGQLVAAALAARLALIVPGREPFDWHGPKHAALLFSCERGLLLHAPVLFVILLAGLAVSRTRWAALAFGALLLVHVGAFGFQPSGLRDFTPLMPLAVPLFACALGGLPWWGRRAALLAAGVTTFVALEIMVGRWEGTFSATEVSAETYWSHVVGKRSLLGDVARWLRL